jgi:hypothetical protein
MHMIVSVDDQIYHSLSWVLPNSNSTFVLPYPDNIHCCSSLSILKYSMITNSEDIPAQHPQADKDDSSLSAHLWFPEPEAQEQVITTPQASASSSLLRDRLYIGNLHPTVDE